MGRDDNDPRPGETDGVAVVHIVLSPRQLSGSKYVNCPSYSQIALGTLQETITK